MANAAGDAHAYPVRGAHYLVTFPIMDADGDLVSGATGLDSEVSIDLGTFSDCTNEATEIATSSGIYYLYLTGAETAGKMIIVQTKTTSSGAKTAVNNFYPIRLPVLESGTAQAGAAGTITLASGAAAVDSYYNGLFVLITNDSPSGAQYQLRRVISYVGSTRVATIDSNWGTNPSSASTYDVLVPEGFNTVSWAGVKVASPATAGIPDVNAKNINNVAATSVTTINANLGTTQPTNFTGTGASALVKADTVDVAGAAVNALVSGRMDSSVGAMAADTLTASALATDAVTEIQSGLATSAALATVQADTDDIRSRVPAALTAGGNMKSDALAISGDTVAADNAESFFDGTGYAGTNNVIPTVTSVTNDVGITQAGADKAWSTASRTLTAFGFSVTVGTNSDKTGYTLSTLGIQAIWDALTSALSTVGSIGKLLVNNIDVTISSRLAGASYTAPDNAGIAAIQATTDQFVFTVPNQVDANALSGNLTEADVRDAVGLAAANLDTQLAGINSKTTNLPSDPADQSLVEAAITAGTATTSAEIAALPSADENADALLVRDWTVVAPPASRSVLNALRFLRNKFSTTATAGFVTVYAEDDVTPAYTKPVVTNASAEPIVEG